MRVPVEALPLLYMTALFVLNPVLSEYVQQRKCDSNPGYVLNHTTAFCNSATVTGPTESFVGHLNLVNALPAIMVTTALGRYSDHVGRRTVLFFTLAVLWGKVLMVMCIVNWTLPLWLLYISESVVGATGSSALFLCAAFASAADQSTSANRVWRVALLEAALFAGEILGSLAGGALTSHFGFLSALLLAAWALTLALVLTLCMPEPLSAANRCRTPLTLKDANIFAALALFVRSRSMFFLGMAFFWSVIGFVGYLAVMTVFLRTLFGWSPERVGLFSAADLACRALSILAVLPMLSWGARRWGWPTTDRRLALLGFAAFSAQMLLYGFLQHPAATLALVPLGLLSGMPVPIVRGLASKLAGPDEQGHLFSAIAAVESISFLIGGSLFPFIFSVTVDSYIAASYIAACVATIVATLCMLPVGRDRSLDAPAAGAHLQSVDRADDDDPSVVDAQAASAPLFVTGQKTQYSASLGRSNDRRPLIN